MEEQIVRLLGDLADALRSYHHRDYGPASDANLLAFLNWFCQELARLLPVAPDR